jgi:hypothetical protein
MAQQGGKRPVRTKSQVKPVSGPGALSQRTDMVASDPNVYGDRKATQELMSAAPMAKAQPVPSAPPITSLFAPTERPNEPVTAGNPLGPGPGPEALNLPARSFSATQILSRLAQNDPTGEVEMILQDLSSRGII